jgi:hypothetical protein
MKTGKPYGMEFRSLTSPLMRGDMEVAGCDQPGAKVRNG